MPPLPGEPLRKVTLNLFEEDCCKLENMIGHGWTEHVREVIHGYIKNIRPTMPRRNTLGDFFNE